MSVEHPEPVELNTWIRTIRRCSGTAGGEIRTSAVYSSSNNHGTETAAVFCVGMEDCGDLVSY